MEGSGGGDVWLVNTTMGGNEGWMGWMDLDRRGWRDIVGGSMPFYEATRRAFVAAPSSHGHQAGNFVRANIHRLRIDFTFDVHFFRDLALPIFRNKKHAARNNSFFPGRGTKLPPNGG